MSDGYKQFFKSAHDARSAVTKPMPKSSRPSSSSSKVPPKSSSTAQKRSTAEIRFSRKSSASPTPWRTIGVMSLTLASLGFYVAAPDVCERWFARIEVSAFGQASAKSTAAAEKAKVKGKGAEKSAAGEQSAGLAKNPDETRMGQEDLSHFDKLKQRKDELDLREKELGQLEEELQRQKVELDKRITQLEDMRNQIAQVLKDRVELDQEKVAKLVDLYSNMKPKQAAEILGTINEELAVEVLAKMKKKNAAEIMNLIPADKAKVLSEKYTGYRRIHNQNGKG